MITEEDVKTSLGKKYKKGTVYKIVQKGPQLLSKLAKGYKMVGKLDGGVVYGNTEMIIITEDKKTGVKK